jgi:hypothetical protein
MLAGHEDLARAREALVHSGAPAADRLLAAWPMFWKAMFYEPHWPAVLRQRASELVERMLQEGQASTTVAALSDAEAQELVNDVRRFIDDFSRHATAQKQARVQIEPMDAQRDSVPGSR